MTNTTKSGNSNLASIVNNLLLEARESFHRRCIIFSGSKNWCHNSLEIACKENKLANLLVVSSTDADIGNSKKIQPAEAIQYLGHEFEHAAIDFHDGFDPNLLGAISGTVSGGGLLILLSPPTSALPEFEDPERQRMTIWPYKEKHVGNRFLQRLQKLITHSTDITLIQENEKLPAPQHIKTGKKLQVFLENETCRTIDQKQAVDSILRVVHGHRRRPLVITANRGRGKSASLGIAAAALLSQGINRIIVTGPRLSSTAMVFKHAKQLIPDAQFSPGKLVDNAGLLEYIAPDVLCRESPKCGLLLVDEAAAIPTTMLHQLLNKYSRIVFATTTYGYEGTGRGFTIKFQDTLNQETPGWHAEEMNLPIRWAPHDPVEAFVFRCLCLDARVDKFGSTHDPKQIIYEKLDRDQLIDSENLLAAIFGLLVLAHYQTQPRDLRYLLDAIDLDIFVARYNNTVIGTAVVEQEGGLDSSTAQSVYRNERRVTGHLLPQTLESFAGIKNASTAKYLRIVRIAVQPELRRQGIGQQLLESIESDAKALGLDVIGSNFGASSDLLTFWNKAGYSPTHIGLKHNTSTGTNAITYLKPLSDNGRTICRNAINKLETKFTFQLSEAYQTIDADVVTEVYRALSKDNKSHFTTDEWEDITSFANSLRGYEVNALAIHRFVKHCFIAGKIHKICDKRNRHLLIKKVLQKQSWQEIVAGLEFEGKQQTIQALRSIIGKLIDDAAVCDSIKIEKNLQ